MLNHKLLKVLPCLDNQELKRLKNFVRSSYINRKYNKDKVIKLLDYILKNNTPSNQEKLKKDHISQYFFPSHPFQQNTKNPIDTLTSDLFSLVRQFILWEDISGNMGSGREHLAMARFYRKNNMKEYFEQTIKQFRRNSLKLKIKDEAEFLNAFHIEKEEAAYQSIFSTLSGDGNQVAVHTSLDSYYAITKLEVTCSLLYKQLVGELKAGEAFLLSNFLVQEFPNYSALQSPLANLYFLVIQLIQDLENDELLSEFKSKLVEYEHLVSPIKYRNLMAFYRNFRGLQYQREAGGLELINKIFDLYKDHLEKGYFHIYGNKILPASLKVLVNLAIKTGKDDWAKKLLYTYTPKRITGTYYPQEFHSLCLAEVLFSRKEFGKAFTQLEYRNFNDANFSIMADVLLIKIYYATKDELLDGRIRALEQKVRRSKLASQPKESYLNFLKVMYKVVKHRVNPSGAKWQNLHKSVKQLVPLIEREWLLNEVLR